MVKNVFHDANSGEFSLGNSLKTIIRCIASRYVRSSSIKMFLFVYFFVCLFFVCMFVPIFVCFSGITLL